MILYEMSDQWNHTATAGASAREGLVGGFFLRGRGSRGDASRGLHARPDDRVVEIKPPLLLACSASLEGIPDGHGR